MPNSDGIELKDLSKQFEFICLCREIDKCENVDTLKSLFKSYIKLHLSTLETMSSIKPI